VAGRNEVLQKVISSTQLATGRTAHNGAAPYQGGPMFLQPVIPAQLPGKDPEQ